MAQECTSVLLPNHTPLLVVSTNVVTRESVNVCLGIDISSSYQPGNEDVEE